MTANNARVESRFRAWTSVALGVVALPLGLSTAALVDSPAVAIIAPFGSAALIVVGILDLRRQ